MRLRIAALALVLSTTLAGIALAGGDGIVGRWKCNFVQDSQTINFWMVDLENKDGKLVGAVVPTRAGLPGGKLNDLAVDGDLLRFVLKLDNGIEFRFEGKLPRAGGKKILGSVQRPGAALNPAYLEATQAKTALGVMQEAVTRSPNDPRVFSTLLELVPLAGKEKMAAKDLQEMVDSVVASSEAYGPTFHADFGVRLLDALETDYPALVVEAAAKIEKSIDPKSETRLQLVSTLVSSLKKLGRTDEAAKFAAEVDAAEEPAFKAYLAKEFDFKIPPSGVKAGRPVLVELFTGAQCAPCVAADLACDALEKSFGDDQAVVLQYHLHIPGPDPLTAVDNLERVGFYGDSFRGTPAAFFNGGITVKGGGGADDAEEKFKEYASVVDKCASAPETAKVTASATRKGDAISIKADVKSGETGKVKLRIALTEDWIRYKGSNGVRYHRNVVRAMPGGAEGFGGDPKGFSKELTIDLAKLRTDLAASLEAYATKEEVRFPSAQRPMRLENLHVVAFLQSDDNGEVLAVTRVPVRGEAK